MSTDMRRQFGDEVLSCFEYRNEVLLCGTVTKYLSEVACVGYGGLSFLQRESVIAPGCKICGRDQLRLRNPELEDAAVASYKARIREGLFVDYAVGYEDAIAL